MVLDTISGNFTSFASSLSFDQGIAILQPMVLFVIGMVIYSMFIYKFYRFVAGRDVFKQPEHGAPKLSKAAYVLKYTFFYPAVAFFWFLIIATLLSILSRAITIDNIFLVSMATIATIRITAYYSEDLSKDIAKLVPFALLGVLLLDITQITAEAPLSVITRLPSVMDIVLYYFIFLVLLELVLRVATHGKRKILLVPDKKTSNQDNKY